MGWTAKMTEGESARINEITREQARGAAAALYEEIARIWYDAPFEKVPAAACAHMS